jgi:hypothetical protein
MSKKFSFLARNIQATSRHINVTIHPGLRAGLSADTVDAVFSRIHESSTGEVSSLVLRPDRRHEPVFVTEMHGSKSCSPLISN